MTKKLLYISSFILLLLITCTSEDIYLDHEMKKKEIISKSLWKEDSRLINAVYVHFEKTFFQKLDKKNSFISKYGNPNWEYAQTYHIRDQKYVIIPTIKNGKVFSAIKADIKGVKINYTITYDSNSLIIFKETMFENGKKIKIPTNNEINEYLSRNSKNKHARYEYVCGTRYYQIACMTQFAQWQGNDCEWKESSFCGMIWIDDLPPEDGEYICAGCPEEGGGGGGSGSPTQQSDPCTKAKVGTQKANILLSDSRVNIEFTEALKNAAKNSTNSETGISIGINSNSDIKVSEPVVTQGTTAQIPSPPNGYNTLADGHNHTSSSPPSPGDIWGMLEMVRDNSTYETRYVFGKDASIFALTLNDRQAAIIFLSKYPKSQYINENGGWIDNTNQLFRAIDNARSNLMDGVGDAAYNKALASGWAFMMQQFNMGISLNKTDGNTLKAITTKQINETTYTSSNCN